MPRSPVKAWKAEIDDQEGQRRGRQKGAETGEHGKSLRQIKELSLRHV